MYIWQWKVNKWQICGKNWHWKCMKVYWEMANQNIYIYGKYLCIRIDHRTRQWILYLHVHWFKTMCRLFLRIIKCLFKYHKYLNIAKDIARAWSVQGRDSRNSHMHTYTCVAEALLIEIQCELLRLWPNLVSSCKYVDGRVRRAKVESWKILGKLSIQLALINL